MFRRKAPSEMKALETKEAHRQSRSRDKSTGQSLIELGLIMPILLIMILGVVEVASFLGAYLDGLDLVREAGRFASLRDPFYTGETDMNCSTPEKFNFFYDTACIFSPPAGDPSCVVNDPFCNGVNSSTQLDMTTDDIVISAYTVVNNTVTESFPLGTGYYAYSDHDGDVVHNGNWQKDCDGNVVLLAPLFNETKMNSVLSSVAPPKRGFVAVEYYFCYHHLLNAPLISDILPNPKRVHVYTIISLPAAIPTSTPYQTPTP